MKNYTILFILVLSFLKIHSQILVEDFNYNESSLLTTNGYSIINAGNNPLTVNSPSLNYLNYLSSNVGNTLSLKSIGEDVFKSFSAVTNNVTYASLMLNVDSSGTGDYFFSLNGISGVTQIYIANLYIKTNGQGFNIGINKGTSATPTYFSNVLSFDSTYFIVIKYTKNSSFFDDVVSLFFNPILGAPEPSANILTPVSTLNTDPTVSISAIAFKQGTTGVSPSLKLDGIRVGTTWASVTPRVIPDITPVGPIRICNNLTQDLVINNAYSGSTFQWQKAQLSSSTVFTTILSATNFIYNVNNAGIYRCIINLNGIFDTTNSVKVYDQFSSNLIITTTDTLICQGQSTFLTANSVTTGSTFVWSPSTNLSSQTYQIVSASPSISTQFILYGTSYNGCRDTARVNINVNPKPTAGFNYSPSSGCLKSRRTLNFTNSSTTNGNGSLTYLWNFGDPNSGPSNISTETNPSHSFIGAGFGISSTFSVALIVTNSISGCKDTITSNISVGTFPDATLIDTVNTIEFISCNSSNLTLTVNNGSSTQAINTNYHIIWGDQSADFNSNVFSNINHTFPNSGYYNIKFIVTSGACSDTTIYQAYLGTNPGGSIINPGNTVGCNGDGFVFPFSNITNNSLGTEYLIWTNDGTDTTRFNQSNLLTSYSHVFDSSSCGVTGNTYTISLRALNPCGITYSTVTGIRISKKPKALISYTPNDSVCVASNITFNNVGTTGLVVPTTGTTACTTGKFGWSISPTSGWTLVTGSLGTLTNSNVNFWISGSTSIQIRFNTAGTYNIKLKSGNSQCGTDSAITTIVVNATPTITGPSSLCAGSIIPLTGSGTPTINNPWVSSSTTIATIDNSGTLTGISNGPVTITYTDNNLCSVTKSITVNPLPTISGNSTVCVNSTTNLTGSGIAATQNAWVSSNSSIASVSTTGVVTGVSTGFSNIVFTNNYGCASGPKTINVVASSTIINHPQNDTVCAGSSVTFSVSATGSGLTYQWQQSTNGGNTWTTLSSNANSFYTIASVTTAMNNYKYRVIITGCGTATSNFANLTVLSAAITNQPTSLTLCSGQTASFNVIANLLGLVYQWQQSINGGVTYTNILNSDTNTLVIPSVTITMNNYRYRVLISGCGSTVTSNVAILTVNASTIISTQPVSLTKCVGNSAVFSVSASGSSITYQWQSSTNNGNTWNNITTLGTSSSITLNSVSLAMNGYQYRMIINGLCGSDTSDVAILNVINVNITTNPNNSTACLNSSATFTVAATGIGLTYQWQLSTNSGTTWSNIIGANSLSYTRTAITTTMNNYQYRVIVSGCGTPDTSTAAILTVITASITTQPQSLTKCIIDSATFSVIANGIGLTYQWQLSTNSGVTFNTIVGATSSSYTTPAITALMNNYQYRVLISGCGTAIYSNAAILTTTSTSIVTQPISRIVCPGNSTFFSITASGLGLTYQWQVSTNGGSIWTNISGATSSAYFTPSILLSYNGYQYRVIVSGCGPSVTSTNALLTVNTTTSITSQPNPITTCAGNTATFIVNAVGTGLAYQWQLSTNGGINWTNISGANSNIYTLTGVNTTMNNYQYHVVVSGSCGTVNSLGATLNVNTATITSQPISTPTICSGQSASFSSSASPTGLTYQWQVSTNGGVSWTNIAGANSSTYTIPSVTSSNNGYQYHVIASGCGVPATSLPATLNVGALPTIITQPLSNPNVCVGNTTTISVTASGSNLTYQWQLSTDGGLTFSNILNATTSSYTTPSITSSMNNYKYKVIISGCSSQVQSSISTISIITASIAGQPSNISVCSGNNASFSVNVTGNGYTIQWQQSTDGGITWSNISGQNSSSLTFTSTSNMNGYRYRALVSYCNISVPSNAAILTVNSAIVTTQPINTSVCSGLSATFSANASGIGISYQWQLSIDGGTNWSNISGATNNTFQITSVSSSINGYKYRVVCSTSSCQGINSNPATLTVLVLPTGNLLNPSSANICEGSSVTLTANGGSTYQWYLNNVLQSTTTSPSYSATIAGIYRVNIIGSNGCSTQPSNSVTLSLVRRPTANFIYQNSCVNTPVLFNNQSTTVNSGTVNYNWNFGDGNSVSNPAQPIQHTYINSGTFSVTLTVTPQACPSLLSTYPIQIAIVSPPQNIRYPTATTVVGYSVLLEARTIQGAQSYIWSPTTGLGSSNSQSTTCVFSTPGQQEYLVSIKTAEGCNVHDSIKVISYREVGIQVPNAFSPNGDGQNDYLFPYTTGIRQLKKFKIYDRWGQLLFETTSQLPGWDGKFKGVKQPVESYTWYAEGIDMDGKTILKTGGSMLIR